MRRERREPTLGERLSAVAAFAPVFESPTFSFGTWTDSYEQSDGAWTMPYYTTSDEADRFIATAARFGWVTPKVDWTAWIQSPEARELRHSPERVAGATAEQLQRLLTALVRADRFSEGTLGEAFESGLLLAVVRRAATLLAELDADESPG